MGNTSHFVASEISVACDFDHRRNTMIVLLSVRCPLRPIC